MKPYKAEANADIRGPTTRGDPNELTLWLGGELQNKGLDQELEAGREVSLARLDNTR